MPIFVKSHPLSCLCQPRRPPSTPQLLNPAPPPPPSLSLSLLYLRAFAGLLGYYLDEDAEHSLPKNLGSAVLFLLFLAWCTTSISIGATGITNAFGAMVVFLLFAIILMIIGTYGIEGARASPILFPSPSHLTTSAPVRSPLRPSRSNPYFHPQP